MLLAQVTGLFGALVDSMTTALLRVIDSLYSMSTTQYVVIVLVAFVIWLVLSYRR